MTALRPFALALLAAFALSGCRDDGALRDTAPPPDYLMLTDGNRWVYDDAFQPGATELVKAAAGTLPDGRPMLRVDSVTTRSLSSFATYETDCLLQSRHELSYAYDASTGERCTGTDSRPRLRLPLRAGDHYVLQSTASVPSYSDRDGDGITDAVATSSSVTEIAPETVGVPAGIYQTLRVTTEFRSRWTLSGDGSQQDDVYQTEEWYAAGMGIVQRSSTLGPPTYRVLTGYRLGMRRSETTAPQLVLTAPDPDAVLASAPLEVSAEFNESLDPFTARMTLLDPAGEAVFGHVSTHGRLVTFRPITPLASGVYTATVTYAEDLVGNAAPGASWSFTLP